VDDADASMAAMPAVLNEPSHGSECLDTRHAVKIASIADDVIAFFPFF
jgi:hypothetical protein